MSIRIREVSRRFGAFAALDRVSLDIGDGALVALLGPSGSGKTTLLRVIAGLEQPDAGSIELAGLDATAIRPQERRVGFVFQHYALFRHMRVLDNVAFALRARPRRLRPDEPEIRRRARELLDLVHLGAHADRFPHQLSGGQRQRVALARALAAEPRVLLLDEPFGALDAAVRRELRTWLRELHRRVGLTSVFVTHDQEEAFDIADQVAIFSRGRIVRTGTPAEIYADPGSEFVHRFLGSVNELPGEVIAARIRTRAGGLDLPASGLADGPARLLARPHDVELAREPGPSAPIRALVRHVAAPGIMTRVTVDIDGGGASPWEVLVPHARARELGLAAGQRLHLGVREYAVYPADAG